MVCRKGAEHNLVLFTSWSRRQGVHSKTALKGMIFRKDVKQMRVKPLRVSHGIYTRTMISLAQYIFIFCDFFFVQRNKR